MQEKRSWRFEFARSTGEHSMSEPADDAEVDYPAGMIDPFVKNGTEGA